MICYLHKTANRLSQFEGVFVLAVDRQILSSSGSLSSITLAKEAVMKTVNLLNRSLVLSYGIACYAIFFGVFLYSVGFIGNIVVPTTLDGERRTDLSTAVVVNLILL